MEELIEYTRITFEEENININNLTCTANMISGSEMPCVCIPSVALNYCMIVTACCYTDLDMKSKIKWSKKYKTYLPECFFKWQKIAPNLRPEIGEKFTYLYKSLCNIKTNGFAYIKNRYLEKGYIRYSDNKEFLLMTKNDSFANSSDYFKFFLSVAEANKNEGDTSSYVEKLFRLFLFLFPPIGITVIAKNHKFYKTNNEFIKYNSQLLYNYTQLIVKCSDPSNRPRDIFNTITTFVGFDIMAINDELVNKSPDNSMSLKELINIRVNFGVKTLKKYKLI